MGKSDKATMKRRAHDVLRLIVSGAQLPEVRAYADQHQWSISDRQLRRYMRAADKAFARITQRNRRKLMGRHLMQRNAIYARAVSKGDLKTALAALKDEADLQGLYPGPDLKGETPEEKTRRLFGPEVKPEISRAIRAVRLVNAEASGDRTQQRLIEASSPQILYQLRDTQFPIQMLHLLATQYVAEQLDHAGMVMYMTLSALTQSSNSDETLDEHLQFCDYATALHAYLFKTGKEGWELFCQQIGVDGSYLVSENYNGLALDLITERICGLAPSAEQLKATLLERGDDVGAVVMAPELTKSWQRMFAKVTREL